MAWKDLKQDLEELFGSSPWDEQVAMRKVWYTPQHAEYMHYYRRTQKYRAAHRELMRKHRAANGRNDSREALDRRNAKKRADRLAKRLKTATLGPSSQT